MQNATLAPPTALRVHRSLLASLERRCLVWMALRLPDRVQPDHLTALGLLALCGAGVGYWTARFHPFAGLATATACLALNWFGDSLDGTLARVRDRQRPRYGFYVDHVVDMAGAVLLLGGLASSDLMDPRIAIGLLVLFLLLSCEAFLAASTLGVFELAQFGLGPTELRLLLAAGNVAALWHPAVQAFGRAWTLFDAGGAIGALGMAVVLLATVVRHAVRLHRIERLP